MTTPRAHHRHHRPGRLLPGRAAARQGLRGDRHGAPQSSTTNFERIAHLQDRVVLDPYTSSGDLLDEVSLIAILREYRPDEVYNLAAQSFVQTSFSQPVLTGEITALGVTRLLDAIRIVDPEIRFYQASSSEMFGKVQEVPQTETHAVLPAVALRRRQGLRPLDHRQLPRVLRPPRQQRHPVQPRVAAARARVRAAEDRATAWPGSSSGMADGAAARQPRRRARLGLRRRLRRGDVADAPAGRARRLRRRHRARRTRCGGSARSRSGTSASTGRTTSCIDEQFMRPAEVDLLVGDSAKARDGARLEAADDASRSS